jgi:hypothetical protein
VKNARVISAQYPKNVGAIIQITKKKPNPPEKAIKMA